MTGFINRLLRVEPGEWPKLAQFGLLGFLLQMGLGIGFSAGDAAFLAHAGAERLALIFMMTPAVMLIYTALFSYLLVRFSIDRVVDATIALLVGGGLVAFLILGMDLPPAWELPVYFGLKLYLAMWYIAIYSLFWNYADGFFTIQDGKRIFPLLAAAAAFGMTCGSLLVSYLAGTIPLSGFFLIWAEIAVITLPVALFLRRRWSRLADSDVDEGGEGVAGQIAQVAHTFRTSRYTFVLTLTLFVTLLLTNLAEFQYSSIFQKGRSEAELAALLGTLYAAANIFNVLVCLFLYTRLVGRFGVRNVALIMPISYFAAFGILFVTGSFEGALAAFFAYHGILTSIEYNNQNLLFNAVPSATKRPVRTIVEGMAEPLASFVAGGFLLLAAARTDIRELSGIGVILGALLMVIVIALRQLYPSAMARNMQAMVLNFRRGPARASADAGGETLSRAQILTLIQSRDRADRERSIAATARNRDVPAIPSILESAAWLSPGERHQAEAMLVDWGDTTIPRLVAALDDRALPYRSRALAARALARLSYALFESRLDALVQGELRDAQRRFAIADAFDSVASRSTAIALLARHHRQMIGVTADFAIELLARGGRLPDFDLLIISLHSANPKVRANALEAIENGVDHITFTLLNTLLNHEAAASRPDDRELVTLLERGLTSVDPIELIASAQALRDLVPSDRLGHHLRQSLSRRLSTLERRTILKLLDLDSRPGPTLIDIIDALARIPAFAPATTEAQMRLARRVTANRPGDEGAMAITLDGFSLWLADSDIRDLASRYPDLALSMLKASDDRSYAA